MTPVWLIQADVFRRTFEPIRQEVRRQGWTSAIVDHRLSNGVLPEVGGRRLQPGDPVVFSGTFPLMRHIQLHYDWRPGGWCAAENFDCAVYYPQFRQFLLNSDYSFLDHNSVANIAESVANEHAQEGRVFMRPTRMEKVFTGRCVSTEEVVDTTAAYAWSKCNFLVAPPRTVEREWRLVISDDRVVTGSLYRVNGESEVRTGYPAEVEAFAHEVLRSTTWRPDPIFMMDICESEGALRVVELNSFSCSGIYQCDASALVNEVRRLLDNIAP